MKEQIPPPVILPEEGFEGDFIIATYFFRATSDINVYDKAKTFAAGQTLGTWLPVPGITPEMSKKYGGKVVSVYDIPPAELNPDVPGETCHIIQIAFPDENYLPQFPMLLTTLLGNDVSTSAQVKLIDLKFSKKFLASFKGPRFGIDGIYKYFNIERRPLIINMIKPCLGYSAREGAEIFRSIALGGVDIIKDDELFADTSYSTIEERVRAYTAIAKQVQKQTGHLTRYCVNITDRPDRMIEHAHRAVNAGAEMLMINFVAAGLGSLHAITEDPEITIPVLAHFATAGSMTESPYTGLSTPLLLGKFPRLAGADLSMCSSPYSTYPYLKSRYEQVVNYLRLPLGNILPAMPVIGGGVHPNSAEKIVADLGKEITLVSGGAIIGHPDGPTEGAKAMMQAAIALGRGIKLNEIAKEKGYGSLKKSLDEWQ
ncbi:MAG: transcriptional regulator [Actinobacteria bacterium]|nr:transcriptional regulator [Actinomycetota bacterium]